MKDKKQRLTILIISILVLVIGMSYAYYSAVVQGTGNANAEASGKTATIGEVEFNGETTFDSSTLDEIYPGFIGIQEFTISPYKDGTGIYEVDLQASVPEAFGNDIKLTIYKTSDKTNNNVTRTEGTLTITNNQYTKQDVLTINGVLEKVYEKSLTTTTETMIEQVVFAIENNAFTTPSVTPDGYYTYYAVYEYLDNGNQNNQQGLDFEGKITVKYVSDTELGAAAYISSLAGNSPKNSIAIIDKGTMYDTDGETEICTNTMAYDDFGNLRYVGKNPCNYVTFNGEEPSLVDEYMIYVDSTMSSFDTLENCTSSLQSYLSMSILAGLDGACEFNDQTNKYDMNLEGFLEKGGSFSNANDCENSSYAGIFNSTCQVTGNKVMVGGWRIIGNVEGSLKIIRNTSIGYFAWDSSTIDVNNGNGINQWGESEYENGNIYNGADIMRLLNPGYENNMDSLYTNCAWNSSISGYQCTLESESSLVNNSLYWNRGSGVCYLDDKQTHSYASCDFTSTGLTNDAKSMIGYHTWYLGSEESDEEIFTSGSLVGIAKNYYAYERSNNNGKNCVYGKYCNDTVIRNTVWDGYVGLVMPSDYGYAVGGDDRNACLLNTSLFDYQNECYKNVWLFDGAYQWTMQPHADARYNQAQSVFDINTLGGVGCAATNHEIRPVVFLKSEVKISGGDGTPTNPYTLTMN